MEYLTFKEYEDMHLSSITEKKFDELVVRAIDNIDVQTNYFYQKHDLDNDVKVRKNAFKKAIAVQIEYQFRYGILTVEDRLNAGDLKSQNIGRTSMSFGDSGNTSSRGSTLSSDAYELLLSVGLLYSGVSVC
ncbi:hypothetical protein ESZ50_08005 [Weissella muntiaci]|uniref:Uncharacterized protein n=1 Tax=Weissella muntiaci TaxID=2508881 RepID=A0A6C2C544_9LACO|nr:hypothetical protein [Weissella muntiaci]TYC48812.1 hypothetical protein ESZ50_08005 [Weissella muntiaci]